MTQPPPPPVWTWPVILTLCISVLALLMAGGSLTWQVISWRRSGPRVTVKTTWGIITGTPRHGAWFVGIDAKNSGRLGTQVHQFGFKLPNGRTIVGWEDFVVGQTVYYPVDLGPGGSASLTYNLEGLRQALTSERLSGKGVQPYVQTGHGTVMGRKIHLGDMVDKLLALE